MATISQIRRENLYGLIQDHFGGNKRQFALAVNVSVNTVSRIFSNTESNRRNVGDALARQVEEHFGLEKGYMDKEQKFGPLADNTTQEAELLWPTNEELIEYAKGNLSPAQFTRTTKTRWVPTPGAWAHQVLNRANEPLITKGAFVALLPEKEPKPGEFGLYLLNENPVIAQNSGLGLEFAGANPTLPDGEKVLIGQVITTLPVNLLSHS